MLFRSLYNASGELVSRFALNVPEYGAPGLGERVSNCTWTQSGEAGRFGAEERRMLRGEITLLYAAPERVTNARFLAQMDSLLKKLGRSEGSVKERVAKLKLDMQYPNPTSEASREQVMKDIDGILADAQKRADLLFDLKPKAPVVARPFPAFREANAAANYNVPAADGSRDRKSTRLNSSH